MEDSGEKGPEIGRNQERKQKKEEEYLLIPMLINRLGIPQLSPARRGSDYRRLKGHGRLLFIYF